MVGSSLIVLHKRVERGAKAGFQMVEPELMLETLLGGKAL